MSSLLSDREEIVPLATDDRILDQIIAKQTP
jgi:hypothetical protein